ncbi:MAG TPA: glycosyltransferase family 4 protein [Vicinamibacterales bacterium]|nr:glycosyltransferase family 4 protein [Vicinamibacterales bacterium]
MTPFKSRRTSVVAVTSEPPWPLDSGGHLRSYHLLRTLASRFDVRLVTPSRGTVSPSAEAALAAQGLHPTLVPTAPRTPVGEGVKIAMAAARREPYVMFNRHRSIAVARTIREELTRSAPDVVYLDHLDSLLYERVRGRAAVVVDMHNVYSRLAGRAAAEAHGRLRRGYLRRETTLLARMERRAVEIADTILAVSAEDAQYFSDLGARRVVLVPNGVDCAAYDRPRAERSDRPTILYVGALGWPPNASAARYLATDVLPVVRRTVADARVVVVGRNPPGELVALARDNRDVEIAADVPDVAPYFRSADVLAVPLETGGGTRLKILEAFAAGLPVVSTAIGCEGIAADDGRHLVVAERPRFAKAVTELLLDPARGRLLAARARELAQARYDWSVVGASACHAVAAAAARVPAPAPARPAFTIERVTNR